MATSVRNQELDLGHIADTRKGLVGGAYTFTTLATSNLRQKNDTWNTAVGGFVGGACLGLRGTAAFWASKVGANRDSRPWLACSPWVWCYTIGYFERF